MSSTKHTRADSSHERVGNTKKNPGIFKGRKWVKKANMWCVYTNFNTPNTPDVQEWE